jgi:hypothetical protein
VDSFLEIWAALGSPSEREAAERLYARLPHADFSCDVLEKKPHALAVLAINGLVWEDLGTSCARPPAPAPPSPTVAVMSRRADLEKLPKTGRDPAESPAHAFRAKKVRMRSWPPPCSCSP